MATLWRGYSRLRERSGMFPEHGLRHSVATAANRSALNDVVHLRHHRLTGIGSKRGHDRHQGLAKRIERLLRIPDVEHLNLPVGLKRRVVEPAGRSSGAGRL